MLTKLNKAAISLLGEVEPQRLYEVIIKESLRLVQARYGSIYLAKKDTLERTYSTVPSTLQVQIRKQGFTYKAFKSKKVAIVKIEKVKQTRREIKDLNVKSVVLIPLCYRNKCIGVISLDSYKENFTEEELKGLRIFGAMATLAIQQGLLYSEMQNAVDQRDLLISLTAHEFRTPLTTINGYAQLLQRKMQKNQSSLQTWAAELHTETKRLIELTNDLLDMSRIKTGKMVFTFQESFLHEILETAATRFRFSFPQHTLMVRNTVKEDGMIIADFDKVLQVFTNILENAGKFSPIAQPIIVTVHKKGKWLITTLADKGRGISQEDVDKIFAGFYKAKNSDETQGMGLGLFISKSIIEAHQGEIRVSSTLGEGTTFEVWLPRAHSFITYPNPRTE